MAAPEKCLCRGCDKNFTRLRYFEAHRISDKAAKWGRRCLTTEEMVDRGMFENADGKWQKPEH